MVGSVKVWPVQDPITLVRWFQKQGLEMVREDWDEIDRLAETEDQEVARLEQEAQRA